MDLNKNYMFENQVKCWDLVQDSKSLELMITIDKEIDDIHGSGKAYLNLECYIPFMEDKYCIKLHEMKDRSKQQTKIYKGDIGIALQDNYLK